MRRELGLIGSTLYRWKGTYMYVYPAATGDHLLVHLCVRHTLEQWWENVQFHKLQRDLTDTALTHFEKRTYFKVPSFILMYSFGCLCTWSCVLIAVSILRCGSRRLPRVSRLLRENESKHKRSLQCSEEVGKSVHWDSLDFWCSMCIPSSSASESAGKLERAH